MKYAIKDSSGQTLARFVFRSDAERFVNMYDPHLERGLTIIGA